jgi:eukaryotic-like serine/threonine-protein kinase
VSREQPHPSSLKPGEVIAGRYRIERVIASGGMGVVFAARHLDLDQLVAIKILRDKILDQGDAVARFMHEARTAARLQNEHVARVYDVGTLPSGVPFMVMEHLPGRDLEDILATNGALSVVSAVDYILQALEAVAEAHAIGIVHRDLKPANLFLVTRTDGTKQLKVLDFGISKPCQGDLAAPISQTSATKLVGSPAYMSPEQVTQPNRIDGRSDIWAIGAILYELLSGSPLFLADTVGGTLAKILQGPIAPLRASRPEVPAGLERVLLRCLERLPGDRYDDVAALARDLAPFASPLSQRSVTRIAGVLFKQDSKLCSGSDSAVSAIRSPDAAPLRALRTRAILLGASAVISVAIAICISWWGARTDVPSASANTPSGIGPSPAVPALTASSAPRDQPSPPSSAPTAIDIEPTAPDASPPRTSARRPAADAGTAARQSAPSRPKRSPASPSTARKGASPIDVLGDRQ